MQTRAVRRASAGDYETFTRLFEEMATGDLPPSREAWDATIARTTLLLEEAGATIAYGYVRPLGDLGHVVHVVVDPAARGRGAGGDLLRALAAELRAHGCSRWELNVKVDNAPALALYRRFGLEPRFRSASIRLPWEGLARLPAPARPAESRPVDPADDGRRESELRLAPGLLASKRAAGHLVIELVDPGAPEQAALGLCCFDPAFPGASPFRAADPSLARALLESMRRHARPEHGHVLLAAEDDPPLAKALLDAGGTLRFEMLRMSGPIPAR